MRPPTGEGVAAARGAAGGLGRRPSRGRVHAPHRARHGDPSRRPPRPVVPVASPPRGGACTMNQL
jgi:hypothetical protein